MSNWVRNPRGDWSYYDESGEKVEGYNPLTDLIGQGWKSAKSFIEWSDPKLARFESSVANILGEGFERVNEARKAIKAREDAITEPIMKSIGDRLVWSDEAIPKYGEPLTKSQVKAREDKEFLEAVTALELKHTSSTFQKQQEAAKNFFIKQNAEVE